jgi:hypothetical protein
MQFPWPDGSRARVVIARNPRAEHRRSSLQAAVDRNAENAAELRPSDLRPMSSCLAGEGMAGLGDCSWAACLGASSAAQDRLSSSPGRRSLWAESSLDFDESATAKRAVAFVESSNRLRMDE